MPCILLVVCTCRMQFAPAGFTAMFMIACVQCSLRLFAERIKIARPHAGGGLWWFSGGCVATVNFLRSSLSVGCHSFGGASWGLCGLLGLPGLPTGGRRQGGRPLLINTLALTLSLTLTSTSLSPAVPQSSALHHLPWCHAAWHCQVKRVVWVGIGPVCAVPCRG